jgi:putative hemolysin
MSLTSASGFYLALAGYLLLLLMNAALSAYQVAVVSVRRGRLTQFVEAGNSAARRAEPLVDNPGGFLVASRVAQVALSAGATALAAVAAVLFELVARRHSGSASAGSGSQLLLSYLPALLLGAVVGGLLFHVLGDLLPRGFAATHDETVLLALARPMAQFTWLLAPVRWTVHRMGLSVVGVAGVPFAPPLRGARSDEEIRVLVEGSAEEGILEPEEKEMIHSIIRFTDTTVRQIMVPRIDMNVVEVGTSLPEVVELILREGHTRLPVYEGTVDHIIGVVHAKDLLLPLVEGRREIALKEILRAPYYVPEGKKVDELLHELRREQIQIAIVVDEYGGTSGLVTIEDILEEIVGDIADEYDVEEPQVQPLGDHAYLLDARLSIDDANEQLDLALPGEEYETVGGFVFGQLGRLPEVGEVVRHGDLDFIIAETDGRRISKIQLVRNDNPQEEPPPVAVA